jgi:hypothetical protein
MGKDDTVFFLLSGASTLHKLSTVHLSKKEAKERERESNIITQVCINFLHTPPLTSKG